MGPTYPKEKKPRVKILIDFYHLIMICVFWLIELTLKVFTACTQSPFCINMPLPQSDTKRNNGIEIAPIKKTAIIIWNPGLYLDRIYISKKYRPKLTKLTKFLASAETLDRMFFPTKIFKSFNLGRLFLVRQSFYVLTSNSSIDSDTWRKFQVSCNTSRQRSSDACCCDGRCWSWCFHHNLTDKNK